MIIVEFLRVLEVLNSQDEIAFLVLKHAFEKVGEGLIDVVFFSFAYDFHSFLLHLHVFI